MHKIVWFFEFVPNFVLHRNHMLESWNKANITFRASEQAHNWIVLYTYTILPKELVILERLFCFFKGFFLFLGEGTTSVNSSSLTVVISVWVFLESNTLAFASVWTSEIFACLLLAVSVFVSAVFVLGFNFAGLDKPAVSGFVFATDVCTTIADFGLCWLLTTTCGLCGADPPPDQGMCKGN